MLFQHDETADEPDDAKRKSRAVQVGSFFVLEVKRLGFILLIIPRQRENQRVFCDFGRLKAQAAELDPALRAAAFVAHEQDSDKKQCRNDVGGYCRPLVHTQRNAGCNNHKNKTDADHHALPLNKVIAVAVACLRIGVAGAENHDEPENKQRQHGKQKKAVYPALHHAVFVRVNLRIGTTAGIGGCTVLHAHRHGGRRISLIPFHLPPSVKNQ